MAQARAGWYPWPDGSQHYWDGTRWVPPSPSQTVDARESGGRSKQWRARLSGLSTGVVVLVAAVVGLPASLASAGVIAATVSSFAPTSESATVTKIVDGDTFDVSATDGNKRIRLLNVDTPESVKPGTAVQCLAVEATSTLAEIMPVGSKVTLRFDTVRLDKYGRTLAGVTTADGKLVNAELARRGLGLPVVFDNNRKFEAAVVQASVEAQNAQVGLFSPATSCTVAADVAKVEAAVAALKSAPTPTTTAEADRIVAEAAGVAALAAALDARLGSTEAFEVTALPETVLGRYRALAASAASSTGSVSEQAKAAGAGLVTAAQKKAAAKAQVDAQARADAAAKKQAEAQAKAAEAAKEQAPLTLAPPAPKAMSTAKPKATPRPQTSTKPKTAPKPKATSGTTGGSTTGCVIKGNISSEGERIYHVPGGGSYGVTKISVAKGERWFCSESEARSAGWRKARN